MGTTIRPVFFKTEETETLPADLAGLIRKQCGDDAAYLLDYPTIDIHIWRSEEDRARGRYSLYIGESNDVVRRTCQHYDAAGRLRNGKRPDLEAEEGGGEEAQGEGGLAGPPSRSRDRSRALRHRTQALQQIPDAGPGEQAL